jgi:hypothetical protein
MSSSDLDPLDLIDIDHLLSDEEKQIATTMVIAHVQMWQCAPSSQQIGRERSERLQGLTSRLTFDRSIGSAIQVVQRRWEHRSVGTRPFANSSRNECVLSYTAGSPSGAGSRTDLRASRFDPPDVLDAQRLAR